MIGYEQITKEQFYRSGGFSNPRNVRIMRGKSWRYFQKAG